MALKILIVEDERPIAKALQLKLTSSGYEATVAADGMQAISELEKNKFDLILLDLIMPNLDGFGFLDAIKRKPNLPPIIVSSNLSQQEDIDKAKSKGAVGYYVKSNTPLSAIIQQINQYLPHETRQ